MDPLVVVMLVWVGICPLAVVGIVLGIRRLPRSRPVGDAQAPSVTVVVSARNEERDLPRCLDALLALDYPAGKLELVLVDDYSTDGTGALIDAAAAAHAHVIALHTSSLPDNGLRAKARGLSHGFARATGEWVLITDADAAVPATWLRHLLNDLDANVTVVGGSVVVEPRQWWGRIERVLNLLMHPVNHGLAGWGAPIVAIGPNMGVRRDVYERSGGMTATPPRVAEDLTLFLIATRDGRGVMRGYLDPETTAVLTPVPSPSHLLSQMKRFVGGGAVQDRQYALGLTLVLLWGVGVEAFMLFGWRLAVAPWATVIGVKVLADVWLLHTQAQRAGSDMRFYEPLLLQLVQFVMLPILMVSLLGNRPIHWRGEGYDDRLH